MQKLDCIFDLQAPAAMCRGMNNGLRNQHGQCSDGRSFFGSEDDKEWSWGQGGASMQGLCCGNQILIHTNKWYWKWSAMNIQPILPERGLNRIFFRVFGPMRNWHTSGLSTIFNFIKCLTPFHLLTKVSQNAFISWKNSRKLSLLIFWRTQTVASASSKQV